VSLGFSPSSEVHSRITKHLTIGLNLNTDYRMSFETWKGIRANTLQKVLKVDGSGQKRRRSRVKATRHKRCLADFMGIHRICVKL